MTEHSDQEPIVEEDENSQNKTRQFWRAMLVSTVVIMLYVAGLISLAPLFGQFVRQRMSDIYFNSSNASAGSVCTRNISDQNVQIGIKIQKQSADFLLYLSLPNNLISVFVNLFIGSYSDFLGRKLLFFLPLLGAALRSVVLCFVTAFSLSLNWLYLGATLEGLSGGSVAFLIAVFSFTADITEPDRKRTIIIAIMEGLFAVAGAIGSIAVGFIIQDANFMYAAITIAIIFVVSIAILFIFLPETVTYKVERQWSLKVHGKKVLGFFFSGSRKKRALYTLAMLVFFFAYFVNSGGAPVETLYQLDRPFCWSSVKIGYYGAVRKSIGVLCSIVFLKLLQPCLRDMTIALIGVVFGMASFVVEGLAVNDWMLYAVPVIHLISYNLVPVSRAVMSHMTSPLQQGAMFSGLAFMESICTLTSTAVYNAVYQGTVGIFRGTVFLLMAGFGFFTATFAVIFLHLTKNGLPKHEVLVPDPSQHPVDENEEEINPQPGVKRVRLNTIA